MTRSSFPTAAITARSFASRLLRTSNGNDHRATDVSSFPSGNASTARAPRAVALTASRTADPPNKFCSNNFILRDSDCGSATTKTTRLFISFAPTGYRLLVSSNWLNTVASEAASRTVATPDPRRLGTGIPYVGSNKYASPPIRTAGIHGRILPSRSTVPNITPLSPACRSNSRNIQLRWAALPLPDKRISPRSNHRTPLLRAVANSGGSLPIAKC